MVKSVMIKFFIKQLNLIIGYAPHWLKSQKTEKKTDEIRRRLSHQPWAIVCAGLWASGGCARRAVRAGALPPGEPSSDALRKTTSNYAVVPCA